MAVIQKDFNVMGLPMAISRNNPIPLDKTAVWYNLDLLKAYAESDPTAYVGQILGLVDESTNSATAYIITSTAGDIKEVGAATIVDNKTIIIDADGALGLYGFAETFYKYIPATEDVDAHYEKVKVGDINPDTNIAYEWTPGLEPKVVLENGKYVLGWYEPNPTTMEGVSASIAALQNAVNGINGEVTALENKDAEFATALQQANQQIANRYTKDETDSAIAAAVADVDHLHREIVSALPEIENAKENIIYMVPSGLEEDDNKYYEWIVINGVFERVGSWEVNLSAYAKTSDLENKVDKVEGYSLVDNDEIEKLSTVQANAEPNFVKTTGSEFDVDDNGNLTLQHIPTTIDLSSNKTIQDLNTAIDGKVQKQDGYSLVENNLITKLENLPSDAEKNVINGVTTEFAIDENRVLSIVSVPATKISDLNKNAEIAEIIGNIQSLSADIGAIDEAILSMQTSINSHGTSITTLTADLSSLVSRVDKHDTDIANIYDILTWKDLTE